MSGWSVKGSEIPHFTWAIPRYANALQIPVCQGRDGSAEDGAGEIDGAGEAMKRGYSYSFNPTGLREQATTQRWDPTPYSLP